MKIVRTIGMALIVLILPILAQAEGLGNARLSLMDGDVQIKPEDSSEWIPGSINMPLREGDRIWVPDRGRAEVQLSSGSQVRLDEMSSLEILNLDRDSAQFYVSEGSAYVNCMAGRERMIQVDGPLASVRAYDRAAFGVDVSNSGITDVSVYRGSVDVESRSGRTTVNAGKTLSLSDDYADIAPLGGQDDWERWNMDRDRRFGERRYTSTQYLPNELDAYAGDFEDNGRWVNAPGYGYVWTPTVSVSAGWSPYRNGRWCWVGNDYVWVGYEPWGWAPYHYGRWSFVASIGWFWVPPVRGAVYWGPGFVGWVSTPTYVAWVPLAPGETYYGHGNYGPNSVNITNVNVNQVVVKNVYKNVYVNNGVTVVHHDTFVKGKRVDYKMDRNPFLQEKVHIGRPDIKPERETRMPVVREIPRTKEPPQRIREVKVQELRKQRPVVRERDRSVFSPNEPEKRLKVKTLDTPQQRKRFREEDRQKMQPEKQRQEERKGGPAERKQDMKPGRPLPSEQKEMERQRSRETRPPDAGRPEQKQMKEEQRRERAAEPAPQKQKKEMQQDKPLPSEQKQQEKNKKVREPGKEDLREEGMPEPPGQERRNGR
ncbi:MAG: iron dicitrate transport regulator FecR [Nitrospirae bacterium]|nr:iron dicitrate transport regulator FecR [Nitrospirota bacterium]